MKVIQCYHNHNMLFLSRYISTYLGVQERDPKAHKFLGQLYEAEDNTEKSVGCYKVRNECSTLLMLKVSLRHLFLLLRSHFRLQGNMNFYEKV